MNSRDTDSINMSKSSQLNALQQTVSVLSVKFMNSQQHFRISSAATEQGAYSHQMFILQAADERHLSKP